MTVQGGLSDWLKATASGTRDGGLRRLLAGAVAPLENELESLLVHAHHVKQGPGPQDRRLRRGLACQRLEAGSWARALCRPSRSERCTT
jgi:hypothetical protein